MVKISTIFALGILVILVPFSGFPIGWKNFLYVLSGAIIVLFSILIRRELHEVLRQLHGDGITTDTFSESAPKQESAE
jgi:hypothetical protein